MQTTLYDQKWNDIWKIDLDESIFDLETNENLVHRALAYFLASSRINIAHTKTRWERRWSTRKIYKQKWTGKARMWANRSPIRKWGWVVFWPRNNRTFEISMNKKERRKALYSVLSTKLKNNELIIVDDIKLDSMKTKNMIEIFSNLPYEKNALLAIPKKDENIEKSASNLPYVKTVLHNYLNVHDLLKYKTLVLMKDCLNVIN